MLIRKFIELSPDAVAQLQELKTEKFELSDGHDFSETIEVMIRYSYEAYKSGVYRIYGK